MLFHRFCVGLANMLLDPVIICTDLLKIILLLKCIQSLDLIIIQSHSIVHFLAEILPVILALDIFEPLVIHIDHFGPNYLEPVVCKLLGLPLSFLLPHACDIHMVRMQVVLLLERIFELVHEGPAADGLTLHRLQEQLVRWSADLVQALLVQVNALIVVVVGMLRTIRILYINLVGILALVRGRLIHVIQLWQPVGIVVSWEARVHGRRTGLEDILPFGEPHRTVHRSLRLVIEFDEGGVLEVACILLYR